MNLKHYMYLKLTLLRCNWEKREKKIAEFFFIQEVYFSSHTTCTMYNEYTCIHKPS